MTDFITHTTSPALSRPGRLAVGAGYGLGLGLIYAAVAGTIDLLLVRNLPLRVDWERLWTDIWLSGGAGALLGLVAAWPESTWKGIALGAVTVAAWSLLRSFLLLHLAAFFWLLITFPLVLLSAPIVIVLRLAIDRYQSNLAHTGLRRWWAQAGLGLLLLALGAFAGSWSRMSPLAEKSVRQVHALLQTVLQQPQKPLPLALRDIVDFRQKAGATYGLTQTQSRSFQSGVDVQVLFDNGYAIVCVVDASTQTIFCFEGSQSPLGDWQPGASP